VCTSSTSQDLYKQEAKSLSELSIEEVCQWFTSIGLQKCLPLIREAKLCGSDIASVDANTLDILHISSLEDRERLLSAIYNALHPPSTMTQTLDSLLDPETLEPSKTETSTTDSASMSRSTSSPHDKQTNSASEPSPDMNGEKGDVNKNAQVNQPGKEERIRELNRQVDSLQNVILQVQELHHGLVAFCSEIKNMDPDANVGRLGSAELKQRLEMVNSQLLEKRQRLQILRDNINNSAAHKNKQLEVHLLEKIKLNCQVFKEEITIVHLNRQATHLLNAWQGSARKVQQKKSLGSLSQLVTPQSPAMLMVVQEKQLSDGHYGFTCCHRDDRGLVVVKVDNSHLCVGDRLVEVNGVPVVSATLEELNDLLRLGPCVQIVVLRQPPPTLVSTCLKQPDISPDHVQTLWPQRDEVTTETAPQR
uniref:PDZ domain-containing protein n=1 Tax=Poecilia formosa TaxID=48698 RepID=A0A096MFM7_POEFO